VSLCGRFFFTPKKIFLLFSNDEKDKHKRREGTLKTWEKNISKVTRKKRRGTPKTDTKKTTDDLLERVPALVRSIDRSITTTTEYRVHRHRQKPKLGDLFLFDAAL